MPPATVNIEELNLRKLNNKQLLLYSSITGIGIIFGLAFSVYFFIFKDDIFKSSIYVLYIIVGIFAFLRVRYLSDYNGIKKTENIKEREN